MLESGQQGKVAAVVVTCRLPCAAASPAQLPTWRVCPPFVCLHPTAAQSAQLLIPCTCLHLAIARLHTRLPTHPVTHTHRTEMGSFGMGAAKATLLLGAGAGYFSTFARVLSGECTL